jgi:hypothetical protein
MADSLKVLLGCDCDPDRPRYGGLRYDDPGFSQRWRGISEGIALLRERFQRIEETTGIRPRAVFCIRSDTQMQAVHGPESGPVWRYADLWRQLESEGHEMAWHPHLWRWDERDGCWFQETRDSEWIMKCLNVGHSEFSRAFGRPPVTCHMGWTFHNDATMQTISNLGVKIDFSASPGVYFEGGPGDAGSKFDNRIDWIGTPQRWYHPSSADYRRPPQGAETGLPLVELPKFTSQSALLKKAKGFASRSRKGARSSVFLQVTALPLLYGRIIKERFRSPEAEPFFATYFHPDELLQAGYGSSRGFLYSLDNLERNLVSIIETAGKKGRDVAFVTGAEVVREICETRNG